MAKTLEQLRLSETLTPDERDRLGLHAENYIANYLNEGVPEADILRTIKSGGFPPVVQKIYLAEYNKLVAPIMGGNKMFPMLLIAGAVIGVLFYANSKT